MLSVQNTGYELKFSWQFPTLPFRGCMNAPGKLWMHSLPVMYVKVDTVLWLLNSAIPVLYTQYFALAALTGRPIRPSWL